jgi:H-type lectin domain
MVAAGDLIRASDDKVIDTGTATVTVSTSSNYFTTAVTFAETFSATPKVAVGIKQGSSGSKAVVGGVTSVTSTGFTAYVRSGDNANFGGGASYDLDWIAVGT